MPRTHLVALDVENLGVIDEARLDFDEGFTVLTGETGAGKTLVIDALTLCLGGDARTPRGGGELRVSALFNDVAGTEVSLSRALAPGGRLRGSLDAMAASAEALAQRGSSLLVIHGQHDSLRLRQKGELVRLLDAYGGIDTAALVGARGRVATLEAERASLGGSPAQREKDLEFLAFQLREIEQADLRDAGELEAVLAELTRLSELREAVSGLNAVADALDGDHDDAVLSRFASALHVLPRGELVDEAGARLRAVLDDAREAVRDLRALGDPDAVDESRLAFLDARAGLLRSLARKYGGSLEAAMAERDRIADERHALEGAADRLLAVDEELRLAVVNEAREASRVGSLRATAAERLAIEVQGQLARVALPHATLDVTVAGVDGSDVEMLFRPNPGAPAGALQQIASGGELSRILLALSLVTTRSDVVAVFDEIDAGVGGGVAQSIGDCLAELATKQQVVAVTHLPTIAARASRHYVVEKAVEGSKTSTRVRLVEGPDRVDEIARMLSGSAASNESRALAEKLLSPTPI